MPETDGKMYAVLEILREINAISSSLLGTVPVFRQISLPLPKLSPPELGFIRTVSWLYVQFFEAGKLGSEFLLRQAAAFGIEESGNWRRHIQALRTYSQHNLDPSEEHSQQIQTYCEIWFRTHCGTSVPGEETHWEQLLDRLVVEAAEHLTLLRGVLRRIEATELVAREQILLQWRRRLERFRAPHEFDKIVAIVVNDVGRPAFDIVPFRQRNYQKWVKALDQLRPDCDFEIEARKLVEASVLSEHSDVLPVTGSDVMATLSVEPGVLVGELLKWAKKSYFERPCSREELLERLKDAHTAMLKGGIGDESH